MQGGKGVSAEVKPLTKGNAVTKACQGMCKDYREAIHDVGAGDSVRKEGAHSDNHLESLGLAWSHTDRGEPTPGIIGTRLYVLKG